MKCELCEIEHDGNYGSGRFCGVTCAKRSSTKKLQLPKCFCLTCNKELFTYRRRKYCSHICQQNYQYKQYIDNWKKGKEHGRNGVDQTSRYIRKYIFEKYKSKCSQCDWDKINPISQKSTLQLEHINGKWDDNQEENLTLLCPNCHSMTSTFGSLNRGNGRTFRRNRKVGMEFYGLH